MTKPYTNPPRPCNSPWDRRRPASTSDKPLPKSARPLNRETSAHLPISSCETSDLDFLALAKSSSSDKFFLFFSSSIAFLSLALSSSISSPSCGFDHPTASLRLPDLSSSAFVAALSASAAACIRSCSSRDSRRAFVEDAAAAARPASPTQ